MRRWLPGLIVVATLIAGCAASPPERASLPEVGEVLDPPAQCSFLVGDPQGVLVQEVIPDSAADGLLLVGDVIVAFDDQPTPDSEALLAALGDRSAGDVVELDLLRDGEDASSMLTLGADPEEGDQPRIGVMIRTQYDVVPATDIDTEVEAGPFIRPISMAGRIYLLDPAQRVWERTDLEVANELNWVATSGGVYFSGEDGGIVDLSTGDTVTHDGFEGWDPIRLIGSVGPDLLLVVTQEVPDDPESVAVGISRFDPVEMTTRWVAPVIQGFGIPISALGSPDGEHIVVVGVNEGGSEITGVAVWDAQGVVTENADLMSLGTPVGWMDNETILFRTNVDVATLLPIQTGEPEEVDLEPVIEGLPLFPVGDGQGVLAIDEQALVLDDLTAPGDLRVVAENCSIGRVGEPGWGA